MCVMMRSNCYFQAMQQPYTSENELNAYPFQHTNRYDQQYAHIYSALDGILKISSFQRHNTVLVQRFASTIRCSEDALLKPSKTLVLPMNGDNTYMYNVEYTQHL